MSSDENRNLEILEKTDIELAGLLVSLKNSDVDDPLDDLVEVVAPLVPLDDELKKRADYIIEYMEKHGTIPNHDDQLNDLAAPDPQPASAASFDELGCLPSDHRLYKKKDDESDDEVLDWNDETHHLKPRALEKEQYAHAKTRVLLEKEERAHSKTKDLLENQRKETGRLALEIYLLNRQLRIKKEEIKKLQEDHDTLQVHSELQSLVLDEPEEVKPTAPKLSASPSK